MIVSVALMLTLSPFQQRDGLFAADFPHPTGYNGLEEYAQAIDVLNSGCWTAYGDWQTPEERVQTQQQTPTNRRFLDETQPAPDPKLVALQQRLRAMNLLQVREEEALNFQQALNLVSVGNTKPCVFPPSWYSGKRISVPNLGGVARLAIDSGYADVAHGDMASLVAKLESAFVSTDRICRTTYIESMVSSIAQRRLLGAFADQLARFSLADAQNIEAFITQFLQEPPGFVQAYRASILTMQTSVTAAIDSFKQNPDGPSKDKTLSAFQQIVGQMSDAEVSQMVHRVQAAIGDEGQTFLAKFNEPENQWLTQDTPDTSRPSDTLPLTPADVEAYYIAHWSLPEIATPRRLLDALTCRTMMRLLRLHACIARFRWEQDRLPSSLDELQLPKGYDFDPLSNEKFVYRRTAEGYKLYSLGWKHAAQIELGAPNLSGGSMPGAVVRP